MANPEHLKILKKGADAWNSWINKNDEAKPDLSRTDLRGINLSGCYLAEAELYGSDLSDQDLTGVTLSDLNLTATKFNRTILTKADLVGARLYMADLIGANLEEANLQTTDFRNADLREAVLRKAFLGGALLTGANLYKADLSEATLNDTTFGDNDLSVALGLDAVNHNGPSIIGIDTVYRSEGDIPETFMRGCGVPDEFITYARSLATAQNPIKFYSCFISYSSKDQPFVDRLYADLQHKGVRCWLASEDLKIGDKFRFTIDESIRVHDKLLLILSEHSVSSLWVEKEVETAMEREREENRILLFPIKLDEATAGIKSGWPADVRRNRHIGDFTSWKDHDSYQKALDRLLRDLKAEEKKS